MAMKVVLVTVVMTTMKLCEAACNSWCKLVHMLPGTGVQAESRSSKEAQKDTLTPSMLNLCRHAAAHSLMLQNTY